ncbi:hypothetical protein NA57DRAFT_51335 [Rhizodiscina lignyota]|uniref:Uncharacterized protein n=1 Tax=Rhizodiscina lignyota TaxID=1504668 RepID=A0A9P4MGH6_9PEZI|nr:hypothetical protein NA57DRAFT_51335 [Rhizodiscina lignyota]
MADGVLRVLSGVELNANNIASMCGTIIKIVAGESERIATLGGLVKVLDDSGWTLYGMTAGHVVDQLLDNDIESSEVDLSDMTSYCGVDSLGTSEGNLTDNDESDISSSDEDEEKVDLVSLISSGSGLNSCTDVSINMPETWAALGCTKALNWHKESAFSGKYFDWSLVDIGNSVPIKPNLLRDLERTGTKMVELQMGSHLNGSLKKRDVIVMRGLQGLKRGSLSSTPARVLLAPGDEFVEVCLLSLSGNSNVIEGDSGSWVVDSTSGEVYGHVVASDLFGDAYIVPLDATFRDMAARLDVVSVVLPTSVDIVPISLLSLAGQIPVESSLSRLALRNSGAEQTEMEYKDSGYSSLRPSPGGSPSAVGTINPPEEYTVYEVIDNGEEKESNDQKGKNNGTGKEMSEKEKEKERNEEQMKLFWNER